MLQFGDRMDDFLRLVCGNNLGRIGFTVSVFENEFAFRGFDQLAVGGGRKEQTEGKDGNQTGGEGAGFRHKERHISSRSAACATDFCRFLQLFLAMRVGPFLSFRPKWRNLLLFLKY